MANKKYHVFGEIQGDYVCCASTSTKMGIAALKCMKCNHVISGSSEALSEYLTCTFCSKKELEMKNETVLQAEDPSLGNKFWQPPKGPLGDMFDPMCQPDIYGWPKASPISPIPVLIPNLSTQKPLESAEVTILKEMIEQSEKDFQTLSNSTYTHQGLALHMISRTQQGLKNLLKLLESKNV